MNNCKQAYFSGIENFKNGDFRKAKECFLVAVQDEAFKENAYLYILKMDFKEGRYDLVRELLETVGNESQVFYKQAALLEKAEYNYKRSKEYYEAMFNYPEMQYCAL